MVTLTVGYVSGIIALAIFLAGLILPNLIALPLVHFLGYRQKALTWSVAGKELQSSLWPSLLRHELAASANVDLAVRVLSATRLLILALLGLAAVVTPLGLHEQIDKSSELSNVQFAYAKDKGPLGLVTQARPSNLTFSRNCGAFYGSSQCPDTTNVPGHVYLDVSRDFVNVLESGLDAQRPTVSSVFDMQWRQYSTYSQKGSNETTVYGVYSQTSVEILHDELKLVEGLVLNLRSGGVGFRNHTVPQDAQWGVEWEEDLLFIEPDTACVDTNLTIQYCGLSENIPFLSQLVDRGGFINLPATHFSLLPADPVHVKLNERAWRGAWIHNYYTMLDRNITARDTGSHAPWDFPYLNSALGQSFHIRPRFVPLDPTAISFTNYGHFMQDGDNPYKTDIKKQHVQCEGETSFAPANASSTAIKCGLLIGNTESIPPLYIPGLDQKAAQGDCWERPLYSCATAVKAVIKTVKFYYKTAECCDLSSVRVLSIRDKQIDEHAKPPYWGVEDFSGPWTTFLITPLWGLVNKDIAKSRERKISAIQSPYVYLPGVIGTAADIKVTQSSTALGYPGIFYRDMIETVYGMYHSAPYDGSANRLLGNKWFDLTRNVTAAARIPNLIFTDLSANGMVGKHGWLSTGHAQRVPVHLYRPHVVYRWVYAVPALLAALVGVGVLILATGCSVFGNGQPTRIRFYLDRLAAGRLMTQRPSDGGMTLPSREWIVQDGSTIIDLRLLDEGLSGQPCQEQKMTAMRVTATVVDRTEASDDPSGVSTGEHSNNIVEYNPGDISEGEDSDGPGEGIYRDNPSNR